MSPEGLLENIYGSKTDVWAFGVFIYEIIHGDTPLAFCQNEVDLKMHIMNPIRPEAFHPSVSMDLRDLVRRCLEVNEHKRISILEIEHTPFMRRIAMEVAVPQHPLELAAHTKSGQKIGVEAIQGKRLNSQQPHDLPYTQNPTGLLMPPMQRGMNQFNSLLSPENKLASSPRVGINATLEE
jgi:serine/threonine protein kinase